MTAPPHINFFCVPCTPMGVRLLITSVAAQNELPTNW